MARRNPITREAREQLKTLFFLHHLPLGHLKAFEHAFLHFDLEPEAVAEALAMGQPQRAIWSGKSRIRNWQHALEEIDQMLRDRQIVTDEIADIEADVGAKVIGAIQKALKTAGIRMSDTVVGYSISYMPFAAFVAAHGDRDAMRMVVREIAEATAVKSVVAANPDLDEGEFRLAVDTMREEILKRYDAAVQPAT